MDQNTNHEHEQLKRQLSDLKDKFNALQQDMLRMEQKLKEKEITVKNPILDEELARNKNVEMSKVETKGEDFLASYKVTQSADELMKVSEVNGLDQQKSEKEQASLESRFGRYWLNKIGMIVFTLGIGFLISYTFKYFTPFLRVLFGYALSAALFGIGSMYEKKDKFRNFGLALLAGGWAIAYFMTYAIYHFESARIITSQPLDICLLSVVALGMIMHALKYKSEGMVSLALFIAFLTSFIGGITTYALFSNIILSVLVVFVAWKMQWTRILAFGVALSYGAHFFWQSGALHPLNENVSSMFLIMYWVLYLIGTHFSQINKDEVRMNQLAAINFANFSLFFVGGQLVSKVFNIQSFAFMFGLGAFYTMLGVFMQSNHRGRLAYSNLIIGVMALTLSLVFKLEYSLLFVWLIEIPFLLFVGYSFKERIYRFLAYTLTGIAFFKYVMDYSYFSRVEDVSFIFWSLSWSELVLLWTFVSFAVCTVIGLMWKKSDDYGDVDQALNHVYSVVSGSALISFVTMKVASSWLGVSFTIEAVLLYALAVVAQMKRFLFFSYFMLVLVWGALIGADIDAGIYRWLQCVLQLAAFFGIYFHAKFNPSKVTADSDTRVVFMAGLMGCGVVLFKYLPHEWLSLGFGMLGVFLILLGMFLKDAPARIGGLVFLAVTLLRIVFFDLAQLDILIKIISFIILGGLFLAISYFYSKYQVGEKDESNLK